MKVVEANIIEYYVRANDSPTYVVGNRGIDEAFRAYVKPIAIFYDQAAANEYVNKLHYQKGVEVFRVLPPKLPEQ